MESLSSIFQSPLVAALISPILAAGVLLFFWYRVGSIHSLLERLWRLVAGKAEVESPQLKKLIQENRDLERFRFIYGLKIETQSELQRLLSWLRLHKVGIARLQRVHKWVDISSAQIVSKPQRRYALTQCALMAAGYLVGCVAIATFFVDDAFLRMKESEIWFKTDGTVVRGIWGNPSVKPEDCHTASSTLAKEFGFSAAEATSLCNAIEDKSIQKLISEAIHVQRVVAGTLGGLAAILMLVTALRLKAAASARELYDEVQRTL